MSSNRKTEMEMEMNSSKIGMSSSEMGLLDIGVCTSVV